MRLLTPKVVHHICIAIILACCYVYNQKLMKNKVQGEEKEDTIIIAEASLELVHIT